MITLTVNGKEHKVPDNIKAAKEVFMAKCCGSMRGMGRNDGLIKRDGNPVCQFSMNGRLWMTEEFETGHWRTVYPSTLLIEIPA